MHMADALLTPAVAGVMYAASAVVAGAAIVAAAAALICGVGGICRHKKSHQQ